MTTYAPAMVQELNVYGVKETRLYVVLAADGTPLTAIEDTPDTVPLWVRGLVRLPSVETRPTVYRQFKRDYPDTTR